MAKGKWPGYLGWSLLVHGLLVFAAGGLLYQLRPAPQPPSIHVTLQEVGGNTAGGAAGVSGNAAGTGENTEQVLQQLLQTPTGPSAEGGEPGKRVLTTGESSAGFSAPSAAGSGTGTASPAGSGTGTGANGGGEGGGEGSGSGAGNGAGSGSEDLSRGPVLSSYHKVYPASARSAGEEGSVLVGVTVSPSGGVTEAWLEESSGYDRLDRAALQSVRQGQFQPALDRTGQPITSTARIRVRYSLEE